MGNFHDAHKANLQSVAQCECFPLIHMTHFWVPYYITQITANMIEVNITVKLDFMLGKILPLKDIIKIESILWLKIKTFGCEPLMFDPYVYMRTLSSVV